MLQVVVDGAASGDLALGRALQITDTLEIRRMWPDIVREIIHPWFLKRTRQQIETQGALGGASWDYSGEEKYEAFKEGEVGHSEVMRWHKGSNERLFPSLTEPGHPDHILREEELSVRIGSSVEYAERLTTGGTGPFGETYPGRELIPWDGDAAKRLITDIQRYIQARVQIREVRAPALQ